MQFSRLSLSHDQRSAFQPEGLVHVATSLREWFETDESRESNASRQESCDSLKSLTDAID
ncbi:MAG: hypothetical protein AAF514_23180 [Verrucomicrobiota bacterium]